MLCSDDKSPHIQRAHGRDSARVINRMLTVLDFLN
jgi:hypothetical protein